jgi:AcrR family transcriptional regulator
MARRLLIERGFEAASVAEIARVAEVPEATVFNYFPTKEDLFYSRLEAFEEELLSAIRGRPPGESVLAAFGRFLTVPRGLVASEDPNVVEQLAAIVDYTRRQILAGTRNPELVRKVRRQTRRALALLGKGLGDYGT